MDKKEAREILHDFQEKFGSVTYSLEIINSCIDSDKEFCKKLLNKLVEEKESLMASWEEVKILLRSKHE